MPDPQAAYAFYQVDVFADRRLKGNPLVVVTAADDLADEQMLALASWTNLSETAFILRPSVPEADYQVRIFTPQRELPFAGHPLDAGLAQWLITDRIAPAAYVAAQGTLLGRAGRVHIRQQDGETWVGGAVSTCISGSITFYTKSLSV